VAKLTLAALFLFTITSSLSASPGTRRALLIGINDYSTSTPSKVPQRDWTNLSGAVNDVEWMRELLSARYGIAPGDIRMLRDREATREAILRAMEEHLVRPAKRGDTILFYYSGHGSQVQNTRSTELDKLDESLVPADSRAGARDIRDKELRAIFNRILDRGARLTIVIDACHSGSGARGPDDGLVRGVKPDPRDIADPSTAPRPEDRGALVIAASEDFDLAYETLDGDKIRGAFSWAFARALRDADRNETVSDTFLRAQARLRAETPSQNPVLAGRADIRLAPFLGDTQAGACERPNIAIERIAPDGTCSILGGWVHGLTVGSHLRVIGTSGVELIVTSLIGAGRAEARLMPARAPADPSNLQPGSLLEISTWAPPALARLRVWIPVAPESASSEARRMSQESVRAGMRAIADPTEETPAVLLRWRKSRWERTGSGSTLFVQIPAPPGLAEQLDAIDGAERVDVPDRADYILTGRLTSAGVQYAWVRPRVTMRDVSRSAMPLRTAWTGLDRDAAPVLRAALQRLIRVHGWHALPSPTGTSPYRLAVRDVATRELSESGKLTGKREYQLVLRLRNPRPATPVLTRYVYAFVIDSNGRSSLLFPRTARGSVENRLPVTQAAGLPIANPPTEIPLGDGGFTVAPPYGVDTYFLLSTDSPLSSTYALEWDGVRAATEGPQSPLEVLLAQALAGTRGDPPPPTSPNWSIERIFFESVPPRSVAR
jgi:hypothetical protein